MIKTSLAAENINALVADRKSHYRGITLSRRRDKFLRDRIEVTSLKI